MDKQKLNNLTIKPTVSVIMNCLNCSKYLREAIDSVYAQTYKDWEIIFWDNASTDSSAEIAKSYDERLRYFRSEETVPLGKARNWAVGQAQGKYIAFLDCDDIWLPRKLEKQIPLFEINLEVGLVFSDTIYFNKKGNVRRLYRNSIPPKGWVFRELLKHYFLSLETVVIKKESLDSLEEWFDERFNVVEEADLFLRLAYNWELDYLNEPLSKWRMHEESWSFSKKELFPHEIELMIKKFIDVFKSFESEYKDEIDTVNKDIQYQYALIDWEKGQPEKARRRLKPLMWGNKKIFITYFISYFPFLFYNKLQRLHGKRPG